MGCSIHFLRHLFSKGRNILAQSEHARERDGTLITAASMTSQDLCQVLVTPETRSTM